MRGVVGLCSAIQIWLCKFCNGAELALAGFAIGLGWLGRDVALQRIVVIAVVLTGVGQIPGIGRMAEVALLLRSSRVFRSCHACGRTKEERAAEDAR